MADAPGRTAPLAGQRIVVTRAPQQSEELIARLRAAGAVTIALPTIEIAPPADPAPLDAALRQWPAYHGFLFTSTNAVRATFQRARELDLPHVRPAASWVCAVGPATAGTLLSVAGDPWRADVVPAEHRAEGVLEALAGRPMNGRRILFPRAAEGRPLLAETLAARGAHVELVEAYRTRLAESSRAPAQALFPAFGKAGRAAMAGADVAIFTSSSTARNLIELLGPDYRLRLAGVTLAAIGPITRAALESFGLAVEVEAVAASATGIVEALLAFRNARAS